MTEIASRIADATRSNEDAVAVPGLEESGVEESAGYKVWANPIGGGAGIVSALPPSEWSPTEGKPVEASTTHVLPNNPCIMPMPQVKPTWGARPANDNYTTLRTILDAAFAHAATGKGKERHARDLPFDKQPMMETTRLVGPGFPLGQAIKKAGEAAGMIERGQYDAAEAECLGAINYLAGCVAWVRERAKETSKKIAEAA
jgi:hypothetical protein